MDDNSLVKSHLLFLLAVTMVNVQNAGVYFCSFPKVDSRTAHKLIAQQLIENRYLIVEQSLPRKRPRCSKASHCLMALPTNRKFENGRLVHCKAKYQTWYCFCRAACVRTYCSCTPGLLLCPECYAEHKVDASMADIVCV